MSFGRRSGLPQPPPVRFLVLFLLICMFWREGEGPLFSPNFCFHLINFFDSGRWELSQFHRSRLRGEDFNKSCVVNFRLSTHLIMVEFSSMCYRFVGFGFLMRSRIDRLMLSEDEAMVKNTIGMEVGFYLVFGDLLARDEISKISIGSCS